MNPAMPENARSGVPPYFDSVISPGPGYMRLTPRLLLERLLLVVSHGQRSQHGAQGEEPHADDERPRMKTPKSQENPVSLWQPELFYTPCTVAAWEGIRMEAEEGTAGADTAKSVVVLHVIISR